MKAVAAVRLVIYVAIIIGVAIFVPAPAKWIGVAGGVLAIAFVLAMAARTRTR